MRRRRNPHDAGQGRATRVGHRRHQLDPSDARREFPLERAPEAYQLLYDGKIRHHAERVTETATVAQEFLDGDNGPAQETSYSTSDCRDGAGFIFRWT